MTWILKVWTSIASLQLSCYGGLPVQLTRKTGVLNPKAENINPRPAREGSDIRSQKHWTRKEWETENHLNTQTGETTKTISEKQTQEVKQQTWNTHPRDQNCDMSKLHLLKTVWKKKLIMNLSFPFNAAYSPWSSSRMFSGFRSLCDRGREGEWEQRGKTMRQTSARVKEADL